MSAMEIGEGNRNQGFQPQTQTTSYDSSSIYDSSEIYEFSGIVVDLTSEETFAPEILSAEDVRRLLGIPRGDRWCDAGDGTEK